MFCSRRALFAHIPCPSLSKCRAPHCLFSHKRDVVVSPDPAASQSPTAAPESFIFPAAINRSSVPRKREASPHSTFGPASTQRVKTSTTSTPDAGDASIASLASSNSLARIAKSSARTITSSPIVTSPRIPSAPGIVTPTVANKVIKPRSARPSSTTSSSTSPPAIDITTISLHPVNPHPPALHAQRLQMASTIALILRERKLSTLPNYDAARLEYEVAGSASVATYINSIKHVIMKLKKVTPESYATERSGPRVSAFEKLKASAPLSFTECEFTDAQILDGLQALVHETNVLRDRGYMVDLPSPEEVAEAVATAKAAGGYETCDRCTRHFKVHAQGQSECVYHPRKSYMSKASDGTRTRIYPCCSQRADESAGCTTFPEHVYRPQGFARLASIIPFETSTTSDPSTAQFPRAVSMDCEMGYSDLGVELIRVTILQYPSNEVLYDTLVKPIGRVIDLNTMYSGVTSVSDDDVPTFGTVRRTVLQSYIGPDTILVGHGLENDLAALRILHTKLVDSALLYPPDNGALALRGIRQSLKNLASKYLQREIQMNVSAEPAGHDSYEDAMAAADLVTRRVKFNMTMHRGGTKVVAS
ncbi:uncharacterized protein V1518DRAFT_408258 [Limtongia smithiae]|uniref:uncharacterized protein n=1 Tax=Limtongia smithiae TaxID=1125753 RepID=UPI0034CDCBDB